MKKPSFSPSLDESDLFPEDAPAVTAHQTREEYVRRGRSGYAKIRNSLVQLPPTKEMGRGRPSTLALLSRNHRAAVLYLALLANWPWLSREDLPLSADTWIRFLTSDAPNALTWTPQSLSHAWGVLEGLDLVTRSYEKRLRKITPHREDGSKATYAAPEGKGDPYFVLPASFWTENLHATMSWPELAVLLILLKETGVRPSTELPIDRAEMYYGLSRTTAEKGLAELRRRHLVQSKARWIQDYDSAEGRRQASLHALLGPFSLAARKQLQAAAQKRRGETRSQPPSGEVSTNDEASTETSAT